MTLMNVDDIAGLCKLWSKLFEDEGFSVVTDGGMVLHGCRTKSRRVRQ